ncbi:YitT family protein [Ammoniphilus sp. YIM 78166]|uniref:YitT family protein n=1 Tax=Ammoniphilus sp. YIM 78166 TaxID=1644106 RepID=UPI00106FC254|nr:YitT family protein [Ammoniphilus sp. YIM 78166]
MASIRMKNIIAIMVGSAIMGFGFNYFNLANGLVEGGIIGLALLLKIMLNWDTGLLNLLFNVPILILGWRYLGTASLIYTLVGTISLSGFLSLFDSFALPMEDPLLAALYAGVSVGIGLGIVFRYGGTTDGVDILANIFQRYFGWSIGRTIFVSDVAVILISLYYLDLTRAMYTLVAVFISAKVIDLVQEGKYSAKEVTIISHLPLEISQAIASEMKRGVTLLDGEGVYTQDKKKVVYCVVARNQVLKLKSIVTRLDPSAFIVVRDVFEVHGKGFSQE